MATIKELLHEKVAASHNCRGAGCCSPCDGPAERSALQRTLNTSESHALGAHVDSLLTQFSIRG